MKVLDRRFIRDQQGGKKSVVMHFMKVDIVGLFKQVELENVEKNQSGEFGIQNKRFRNKKLSCGLTVRKHIGFLRILS